ncbi:MAG: HD domain-containing protein [Limnochordales bacterium]|nr:HD domain-containing protein [Limnochordales bacterium]
MEAWALQRVDKIFKDPVHDSIPIYWRLVQELIDTPEFQRLRRIRQLGTAGSVYHGAEQSRFGHCLGAFHIMNRLLSHLREMGVSLPDEVACVAAVAALLHDVGHGPFSHALEGELTPGIGHEEWTCRIVRSHETHVHQVLAAADPELPGLVVGLITGEIDPGTFPYPFLVSLVSSQLDVDRMDYLLRDSLYTGTLYGRYDLERVIHTLTLHGDRLVFVEKGIPSAEEYVLARYYMYWQVYFHKTTRGEELLLRRAWARAVELYRQGSLPPELLLPSLLPFMREQVDLAAYLAVDDADLSMALKLWRKSPDPILSDLAGRVLDRRLLKPVFKTQRRMVAPERLPAAIEVVRRAGFDPDYYFLVDTARDVAYDYYTEAEESDSVHSGRGAGEIAPVAAGSVTRQKARRAEPILVLDGLGQLRELSKLSDVIRALVSRERMAVNIFVPAECRAEVAALLGQ